jgi:hypothetical protein
MRPRLAKNCLGGCAAEDGRRRSSPDCSIHVAPARIERRRPVLHPGLYRCKPDAFSEPAAGPRFIHMFPRTSQPGRRGTRPPRRRELRRRLPPRTAVLEARQPAPRVDPIEHEGTALTGGAARNVASWLGSCFHPGAHALGRRTARRLRLPRPDVRRPALRRVLARPSPQRRWASRPRRPTRAARPRTVRRIRRPRTPTLTSAAASSSSGAGRFSAAPRTRRGGNACPPVRPACRRTGTPTPAASASRVMAGRTAGRRNRATVGPLRPQPMPRALPSGCRCGSNRRSISGGKRNSRAARAWPTANRGNG